MVEPRKAGWPSSGGGGRSYITRAADPVIIHEVIGVAMVVDEGGGPRLAFRYPWPDSEALADRELTVFHTLPPDFFAKFFKLKSEMCRDGIVEMDVDGVNFTCAQTEIPEDSRRGDVVLFNLVIASIAEVNPPPEDPIFAARLKPKAEEAAHLSAPSTDSLGLTRPDPSAAAATGADPAAGDRKESAANRSTANRSAGKRRKKRRLPGADLDLVCKAAEVLAKAILHEEVRCGYLSDNAKWLLDYLDDPPPRGTIGSGGVYDYRSNWHHGGSSGVRTNTSDMGTADCTRNKFSTNMGHAEQKKYPSQNGNPAVSEGDVGGGSGGQESKQQQWAKDLLKGSQLARDLKGAFHAMVNGGALDLKINRWVTVSLRVTPVAAVEMRPLKNYETILLLDEDSTILASLPEDCCPGMRQLVKVASPLLTLEELSSASDIPLEQVARLTRNMAYWGLARVTDAVCDTNRYQVNRAAIPSLIAPSPILMEFEKKFPENSIMRDLFLFGSGRSLEDILAETEQSQRDTTLKVLIWLLRRDLILQLGRYISLSIPDPPPPTAATNNNSEFGGIGLVEGSCGATAITPKLSGDSTFGDSTATYASSFGGGGGGGVRAWDGYDNSYSSTGSSSALAQRAADARANARAGAGGGGGAWGDGGEGDVLVGNTLRPFEEEYLRQYSGRPEESKIMQKMAPLLRGKMRLRDVLWEAGMDNVAEVKAVLKRYESVLVESWFPIRNSSRPPNNSAGGLLGTGEG